MLTYEERRLERQMGHWYAFWAFCWIIIGAVCMALATTKFDGKYIMSPIISWLIAGLAIAGLVICAVQCGRSHARANY